MRGQYNLQHSQQQKVYKIAVLDQERTTGVFPIKKRKTFCDETFDEWRSDFTTVTILSMLSGLMISALKQEEV